MKKWLWKRAPKREGQRSRPLVVESLENRTLLSVALAAMGDSITAPYAGTSKGRAGDLSWAELLQTLRSPDDVAVYNFARDGATSTTLLSQGQHTRTAELVAEGSVDSALLLIGVNDLTSNFSSVLAGNPGPFVQTLVTNLTQILDTVTSAGPVNLVMANLPDVGVTPLIQSAFGHNQQYYQRTTEATVLANQQIEKLAAAYNVPVLDLFDLGYLALSPLEIGGVEVNQFFAPDGYHPGTVAQGVIANTFFAALNLGYGVDVTGLPLSDQEILTTAGIDHPPGETYLDVSNFVIVNSGNGSSAPAGATATQAAETGSGPAAFRWAGFGQALATGKPGLPATFAATPVVRPSTESPGPAARIATWSLAEVSRGVSGQALPAAAHQQAVIRPDLLDAIFAEADTVFIPDVSRA